MSIFVIFMDFFEMASIPITKQIGLCCRDGEFVNARGVKFDSSSAASPQPGDASDAESSVGADGAVAAAAAAMADAADADG